MNYFERLKIFSIIEMIHSEIMKDKNVSLDLSQLFLGVGCGRGKIWIGSLLIFLKILTFRTGMILKKTTLFLLGWLNNNLKTSCQALFCMPKILGSNAPKARPVHLSI